MTSAFLSLPSHLVCRSIVEYTVWVCKAGSALVSGCPWDCSPEPGRISEREKLCKNHSAFFFFLPVNFTLQVWLSFIARSGLAPFSWHLGHNVFTPAYTFNNKYKHPKLFQFPLLTGCTWDLLSGTETAPYWQSLQVEKTANHLVSTWLIISVFTSNALSITHVLQKCATCAIKEQLMWFHFALLAL